ncbi:hypothetical protein BLA29_007362 [Euroglyphus maynei]|uniref:Uncharacterized protein n=1 Tax=Euroglyphus maynei TaxID=6958 RepID=A0A1Y3BB11_EURMA|nr:hypothetical protein BLA29_007362 [Euroglyphus maynei]
MRRRKSSCPNIEPRRTSTTPNRMNLISPVFNMDKLFNVEFDQDSQISLIKSQQSSFDQQQSPDIAFFRNDIQQPKSTRDGRCATIVIEPESEEQKDEITRQLPLLTADLTLLEG